MTKSSQQNENAESNVTNIETANNKDNTAESADSVSAFPGRILRAARGELNYSIEQVAQELHLRPSVVSAIESEQYDEFSSDVFLKGYFRSYCRLVNLHEERMVELLELQLNIRQKGLDDAALLVKKDKQLENRKKGLVVFVVIVVILAAAFFTYSAFTQDDSEQQAASVIMPSDNDAQAESINQEKPEGVKKSTSNIDESIASAVVTKKIIQTQKEQEIQPENQSDYRKQDVQKRQEIVDAVASTKQSKKIINSLFEAKFSGDCWFKLTDGNQKTVFAALKHAGDRVSYSGLAPFKVILGDASKAQINFEGSDVNLHSYTAKNGRAQLTLNKG